MSKFGIQSLSKTVLIGIFLFVICSPSIITMFAPKSEMSMAEKRKLAIMPEFKLNMQSIKNFPAQFEKYYNDHFGLRSALIHCNSYIYAKWLKKSPISLVVIGKKGWLYYTENDLIRDYRGLVTLRPSELYKWKKNLDAKNKWLTAHGIPYLFVVGPNKQSIYPEYMPSRLNKVNNQTKLDQLLAYLDQYSDVPIMDLRKPLLAAKKEGLVYFKEDTHWNPLGALVAYKSIMSWMVERHLDVKAVDYSLSDIEILNEKCGNAACLGISDISMPGLAWNPSFRLKSSCARQLNIFIPKAGLTPMEKNTRPLAMGCTKSRLNAIVIRDSFMIDVEPYLSEQFRIVCYIHLGHPWQIDINDDIVKLIKVIHPDIVIEEKVERVLFYTQ